MIGRDDTIATEVSRLADTAAGAIRAINHATIAGPPMPAPAVYDVLGSLTRLGHGLAQASEQLADRLAASAEEYELYEDEGRDPLRQIAAAAAAMAQAAEGARRFGEAASAAQSAISRQGYRA